MNLPEEKGVKLTGAAGSPPAVRRHGGTTSSSENGSFGGVFTVLKKNDRWTESHSCINDA